ncbi:hypothetical protein V565_077940 [Rhizoctonia solani 123E]|uniref:Laminin domain protein n=1 Tax=Rhizoctonia solani 123E TaxID=1423351 RepID=A0A074RTU6_9AGAM|nr:hypothetical protein V565_077940 [Rhizoctonia solani 123E]
MTSSALTHETVSLVPPQLPPFLANVINLKPITGIPGREEIKLVHEAVRALNNFPHTSELRNSDLSIELSQHLFDIQMEIPNQCATKREPLSFIAPNQISHFIHVVQDIVYDPPTLPAYIPVELKPVTGPPSNADIASVHTALRISESFVNVPSIFDPDLHVQLSQHLFDIQLARHVQRSIVKRSAPVISASENQSVSHSAPSDTNSNNTSPGTTSHIPEPTGAQNPPVVQPSPVDQATSHEDPKESGELRRLSELIMEIRDTLKNGNRILVGTQNSLARGFNATSYHVSSSGGLSSDLGAHSLINDHGEAPETYNLPTFKYTGPYQQVSLAINKLTEDELVRYLRFYNIGEEMIEQEDDVKIKSDMMDDARTALSHRLFLNRR